MKKILKEVLFPAILAIIIGFILGRYVFKTYKENLYDNLTSRKLYLIESGEYDNLETMREENNWNNYVYYKDDDKYKAVVGITNNYDNIDKIKSLYSDNLKVYEYYIPTTSISSKQEEYDKELSNSKDLDSTRKVVDNILKLYRTDNNIRLIQLG